MTDSKPEPSTALTEAERRAIDADERKALDDLVNLIAKLWDEYKTGLDKVGPPWEPDAHSKIGADE